MWECVRLLSPEYKQGCPGYTSLDIRQQSPSEGRRRVFGGCRRSAAAGWSPPSAGADGTAERNPEDALRPGGISSLISSASVAVIFPVLSYGLGELCVLFLLGFIPLRCGYCRKCCASRVENGSGPVCFVEVSRVVFCQSCSRRRTPCRLFSRIIFSNWAKLTKLQRRRPTP